MELKFILELMYKTKDKREKKEMKQRWLYKIASFMSSKSWLKFDQGWTQKIKRD